MGADITALRAARAEARGEPPFVSFDGRDFLLVPYGAPWDAAVAFDNRDWPAFLAAVLVDPAEAVDILPYRLTVEEYQTIWEEVSKVPAGESAAS